MASQVAVAEVAVVPKFVGFRSKTTKEVDGTAKVAAQGFSRIFSKTGTDSGKTVGAGFKKAFDQSSKGTSDRLTKALQADVAKASRALSTARDKERDAIGKVRVAQAQLNEANKKYAAESSQVIRAQERLETSSRQLRQSHSRTEEATDDLKKAQGELANAADRAGDELSDAGKRGVNGFRSSVVGGVKSFALPLIGAFAALGIGRIAVNAFNDAKDFFLGSIDIASDLAESVNAVQVSYGDAADAVLKLGENSAQAFGLSKRDLNSYSTQFSSFVKTIAGSGGDVAGTLEDLVGRGTDFASVFNLDVADALALFQSGLAGETEPLRKYGKDLSAARVEAYALAHGIGDGTGELTEAQKVQARYGALMEQTNDVAGDFVATQDEVANANRTNAAEWENVRASLGDSFLPIAKDLAGVLGDDVIPVIADLVEEYGPELADAFKDSVPQFKQLADEVLPLLPGLFKELAESLPPFIDFLMTVLPAGIETAGKFANGAQQISDFFTGVGEYLDESNAKWANGAEQIGGFFDAVGQRFEESKGQLENGAEQWGTFFEGLGANLENGGQQIATYFDESNARWANGWTQISTFFGEVGAAFENGKQQLSDFAGTVGTKIEEAIEFIRTLPERAMEALGDLGDDLIQSGRDFMGGFIQGIKESPVGEAVSGVLDWVGGFFPHSPALRGPFAGSGWTKLAKSGEATWDQYLSGMGKTGPDFPEFPGTPRGQGSAGTATPYAVGSSAGAAVSQVNYFDKTDPWVAAQLANQMLASAARRARS